MKYGFLLLLALSACGREQTSEARQSPAEDHRIYNWVSGYTFGGQNTNRSPYNCLTVRVDGEAYMSPCGRGLNQQEFSWAIIRNNRTGQDEAKIRWARRDRAGRHICLQIETDTDNKKKAMWRECNDRVQAQIFEAPMVLIDDGEDDPTTYLSNPQGLLTVDPSSRRTTGVPHIITDVMSVAVKSDARTRDLSQLWRTKRIY